MKKLFLAFITVVTMVVISLTSCNNKKTTSSDEVKVDSVEVVAPIDSLATNSVELVSTDTLEVIE